MNYQLPIDPVPNQQFFTNLGRSQCKITLRTIQGNTYFDLEESTLGVLCKGSLCVDRVNILRSPYLNFLGDFRFVDNEGEDAPHYSGFNTRWILVYSDTGFSDE